MSFISLVVSCETVDFLTVLYPDFRIEYEFDPFNEHDSIYVGKISPKIIDLLRTRANNFVVWVPEGGVEVITRERLFGLCTNRKRNWKPELEYLTTVDFCNRMRILKTLDILPLEEEESGVYDIFRLISSKSKDAIRKALLMSEEIGVHRVLYSILTFYSRILSEGDASSASYTRIIKSCRKRKRVFIQALINCGSQSQMDKELLMIVLILDTM